MADGQRGEGQETLGAQGVRQLRTRSAWRSVRNRAGGQPPLNQTIRPRAVMRDECLLTDGYGLFFVNSAIVIPKEYEEAKGRPRAWTPRKTG
jgi:hypothetical protein